MLVSALRSGEIRKPFVIIAAIRDTMRSDVLKGIYESKLGMPPSLAAALPRKCITHKYPGKEQASSAGPLLPISETQASVLASSVVR